MAVMKIKLLLLLLIAAFVSSTALFGQTSTMTGKVLAVSSSVITVQKDADVWDIKRTSNTSVTGALKVGSTVTVKYDAPDAQKKEGPALTTEPTATPASQ
jgi:hypothetical protein